MFWIAGHLEGGIGQIFQEAGDAGKTRWLNFDIGLGQAFQFTFWVAIIAVPFQNVGAFGVDQLNAQRMFCCRNAKEASKAIIWSSVGQGITYLMLVVGAALFVWYANNPPDGIVAEALEWQEDGTPIRAKQANVFPTWIVTQLPPGVSGLILGGVFAAAISSLDSILAALSQTTLSVLCPGADDRTALRRSRILVLVWGAALAACAIGIRTVESMWDSILSMALSLAGFTQGALLAGFLLAFLPLRRRTRGFLIGAPVSVVVGAYIQGEQLLPWPWFVPIGCLTTLAIACLADRGASDEGKA